MSKKTSGTKELLIGGIVASLMMGGTALATSLGSSTEGHQLFKAQELKQGYQLSKKEKKEGEEKNCSEKHMKGEKHCCEKKCGEKKCSDKKCSDKKCGEKKMKDKDKDCGEKSCSK